MIRIFKFLAFAEKIQDHATEQFYFLSALIVGAVASSLAATISIMGMVFDPFADEPVTGNAALMTMLAGALGGAFISTQRGDPHDNFSKWRNRISYSVVSSLVLTPFLMRIAMVVNFDFHGTQVAIIPNAATILFFSSATAMCAKKIVHRIQEKYFPDDQDNGKP